MHTNRSKGFLAGAGVLLLCVLGVCVRLIWHREPSYEGRSLSYWLDRLNPTVITRSHSVVQWPDQQFRTAAAVTAWIARTREKHQRSAQILLNAGPECLPVLL